MECLYRAEESDFRLAHWHTNNPESEFSARMISMKNQTKQTKRTEEKKINNTQIYRSIN